MPFSWTGGETPESTLGLCANLTSKVWQKQNFVNAPKVRSPPKEAEEDEEEQVEVCFRRGVQRST